MNFHIKPHCTSSCSFKQINMDSDKPSMSLLAKHEVPADWRKLTMCQSCSRCPVSITIEQNAPWEETPRNPATIGYCTASSPVVGKKSPAGLRNVSTCMCGWMCNLTVLFLPLMSHQCTQCASVFSKLEYINTSVYQAVLHLQGGGVGVGLRCITFVLVFMTERSFILVVKYVFFPYMFWSFVEICFFYYFNEFPLNKSVHLFCLKEKRNSWHTDPGRFSHLEFQQTLNDLCAMDRRRTCTGREHPYYCAGIWRST